MVTFAWIALAVVCLVVGVVGGYYFLSLVGIRRLDDAREEYHRYRSEKKDAAEKEAGAIVASAKQEIKALRESAEKELNRRKQELERRERNFYRMEEKLTHRMDKLDNKLNEAEKARQRAVELEQKLEGKHAAIDEELARVAQLTRDEARETLLKRVEEEMAYELDKRRRELDQQAERDAAQEARNLVVKAIHRCTVDHYSDAIITTVELKKDDMKGRIIGREGRNIRTIEQLTGVDIIIDDTPNVVVLSSFDPVRREVARLAMERLVADGRIHPTKIEEVVAKASEEMEDVVWEAGQEAAFRTGITGLHPELIKLLGRLKFRTSFGQNALKHSIEVSNLASVMAAELGLDPKNAKRGGLLHDIGKAMDAELEGTHPQIGMEFAKKHGENPVVCNVIGGHHGDIEQTVEAVIVQVADAVSASRPGARGEAMTSYLQRLEKLEDIGRSFSGVEKCYAIQAGRELRVLVKPEMVDDVVAYSLCRKIAKRIEEELEYPGMIRVTLIRELRETEFAK
ncbi:ribonuclease Y [bacterium]|nr:ribonuclease Y [bacterium]